jgi:hypothetical protein
MNVLRGERLMRRRKERMKLKMVEMMKPRRYLCVDLEFGELC